MEPLQVTAWMATPIPVADDWTPSLDNLLTFLILDELGLTTPNPTELEVLASLDLVKEKMPIAVGDIQGEWYWQCSSPHYEYTTKTQEVFHKRWDSQDQHLDWQGKRAKWSSSESHTKSWTVPLYSRNPERIDWFVMGDRSELLRLLGFCNTLGKKRKGQVSQWAIAPISMDMHLLTPSMQLMRPMPVGLVQVFPPFRILNWAWRPPAHLPTNRARCYMPTNNAVMIG